MSMSVSTPQLTPEQYIRLELIRYYGYMGDHAVTDMVTNALASFKQLQRNPFDYHFVEHKEKGHDGELIYNIGWYRK